MSGPFDSLPDIPKPVDVDYVGTIGLKVDATDVLRGIFQVRETIPVSGGGPLILVFPKWLPGYHSPRTPIELLAGLVFTAGGERVTWRRDPTEVYAFHLDVPAGAEVVEAEFQFLSPTAPSQGRVVATPDLLSLNWNTVVLYPAGHFVRRITFEPQVTLPPGWGYATPLEAASQAGDTITFAPAPLDVLIDAPLMAGRHHRRIPLDGDSVRLNLFADRPELLEASPEQIAAHQGLVVQADRLFGARHFDHYDFLMALSDELGGEGVEHHRCAEIGTLPNYFTSWDQTAPKREATPHEYVHSWNGKFRRGWDSWIPAYLHPIRSSLMWVYEGQTQHWGHVLAVRSGLWTADEAKELLARTAATQQIRAGRRWRPMCDTTRDPIIAGREPLPWPSWQRSEDYYSEGQLTWLDVDLRLRELSGDTRSLDDFARAFFGHEPDEGNTACTYEADDVFAALNEVAPYDWKAFLAERLDELGSDAAIEGLERGGYRLVYRREQAPFQAQTDALAGASNFAFSVGVIVSTDGTLQEVIWDSPAFEAQLTAGSELVAVNGEAFGVSALERAIIEAEGGPPIRLTVRSGQRVREVELAYHGGPRHPHLERVEGARARIDEILAPL